MKKVFMTLFVTAILSLTGVLFFIYSGIYDVSASRQHTALAKWVMSTTMRASVERRAKGIDAPDLKKEELVLAGVKDFEAMCVACHGAPGKRPEAIGQGLNPPAPDLKKSAQHLSAAELFWVVKNGIKMTGMPAWGTSHDDTALWPVVALLTKLPKLNATAYEDLLNRAEGMGHHTTDIPESDHSHQRNEAVEGGTERATHQHDAPEHLEAKPLRDQDTHEH